jgi:hypothetical protein
MQSLILTTPEDLRALIDEAVTTAVSAAIGEAVTDNDDLPEYLTRKQVADFLACSIATVDNYARAGVLQKRYIGNTPRFKREEVRAALLELYGQQ